MPEHQSSYYCFVPESDSDQLPVSESTTKEGGIKISKVGELKHFFRFLYAVNNQ